METLGTHFAGAFAGARDIGIDTNTDTGSPMSSPTWQVAVDRAVRLCGSQAALARHLKVPRQHVSEARTGGRTIPTDRLPALGELVHMTPAELWTLQEIANMPRRNPFARECDGL
ncbi:hypothetical protein CDL60_01870 [Roseateles noduli]|nr:hypothetical protein CDL60_01870 [Roseateles noduli]